MSNYVIVEGKWSPVLQENRTGKFVALPEKIVASLMELNESGSIGRAKNWLQEQILKAPLWLVKGERYDSLNQLPAPWDVKEG